MPATPSQLRRPKVVSRTVDFGDGATVEFRYDRNKITDTWIQEWNTIEKKRSGHAMNDMLADLIVGWDIINEDGTPYPLTVESFEFLFNIPDKMQLVKDLLTGAAPGEAEGKASSAPHSMPSSVSTLPPPTSLNGQDTLPSPAHSASPSPT